MDRRHFLIALAGLAVAGAAAGCANPANDTDVATTSSTASTANASFPATATHRYGTTTVPAVPQRIVALGQTDHDAVVALGSVPIALSGFAGSAALGQWHPRLLVPRTAR